METERKIVQKRLFVSYGKQNEHMMRQPLKVKRIVVFPGKRLSLQRHKRRAEHWTVVSGNPLVTLDAEDILLKPGDSIDISRGGRHRVSNSGDEPVVFIEVQTGAYFGEDDIERFEDDYGRAGTNVNEIKEFAHSQIRRESDTHQGTGAVRS